MRNFVRIPLNLSSCSFVNMSASRLHVEYSSQLFVRHVARRNTELEAYNSPKLVRAKQASQWKMWAGRHTLAKRPGQNKCQTTLRTSQAVEASPFHIEFTPQSLNIERKNCSSAKQAFSCSMLAGRVQRLDRGHNRQYMLRTADCATPNSMLGTVRC